MAITSPAVSSRCWLLGGSSESRGFSALIRSVVVVALQDNRYRGVYQLSGASFSMSRLGKQQGHHLSVALVSSTQLSVEGQRSSLPGVYSSSSTSSTSGTPASSLIMADVASAALALLDLVDILVLFEWPPSSVPSPAFLFGVCPGASVAGACGSLANLSNAFLPRLKLSTASLIAQFPLNLDSWSVARQSGHFPSLARALRMQREQKVWQQDVTIGEL